MRALKIIKNRSDIGAGTRGSDLGVDALEIAAINAKNDFFNRHQYFDLQTHNESIYNKVNNTFAKRIAFVLEQCKRVRDATEKTLLEGFFPLILSGDHSSALGTMAGIQKAFPKEKVGVIWIDANTDLHSPLSTPSGNVHGMPLGAALGLNNEQLAINDYDQDSLKNWEAMKKLGVYQPLLEPQQLVYFGIRDFETEEAVLLKGLKLKYFSVEQCRKKGIENCAKKALSHLAQMDKIYVSFDVDSFDAELVSNGTGTPVSNGFLVEEISMLLHVLYSSQKMIALEVSEINPLLDHKGNSMAEEVFSIISQLFEL